MTKTETKTERFDIYQTVTDTIIAKLETGLIPWRKPWSTDGRNPSNAISGKEYRGINAFLLSLVSYNDPRWLTFKQAKDLGGNVKKGEKGTFVVFWTTWTPKDKEDGSKVEPLPVLKHYYVFNVEQCENLNIPELESVTRNENERIERAEEIVRSMPLCPAIRHGGNSAFYRPSEDFVNMPHIERFENSDSYYATLFHELAHSTGHESRLNRTEGMANKFGSEKYSFEELIAELGSAFICAHVGLDNSMIDQSAAYIEGWLTVLRNDKKLIMKASSAAQKVADFILGTKFEEN